MGLPHRGVGVGPVQRGAAGSGGVGRRGFAALKQVAAVLLQRGQGGGDGFVLLVAAFQGIHVQQRADSLGAAPVRGGDSGVQLAVKLHGGHALVRVLAGLVGLRLVLLGIGAQGVDVNVLVLVVGRGQRGFSFAFGSVGGLQVGLGRVVRRQPGGDLVVNVLGVSITQDLFHPFDHAGLSFPYIWWAYGSGAAACPAGGCGAATAVGRAGYSFAPVRWGRGGSGVYGCEA